MDHKYVKTLKCQPTLLNKTITEEKEVPKTHVNNVFLQTMIMSIIMISNLFYFERFEEREISKHLIYCLEKGVFTRFPSEPQHNCVMKT